MYIQVYIFRQEVDMRYLPLLLSTFSVLLFVFLMFVCVHVCIYATVCMNRSEDSFWEFIFSFHYVGSEDGNQVVRLGRKYLAQ